MALAFLGNQQGGYARAGADCDGLDGVAGCKRCQTGKLYAMKVMNKRRVKAHQSEKLCWNERKILSLVDSPFVVRQTRFHASKQKKPLLVLTLVWLWAVCVVCVCRCASSTPSRPKRTSSSSSTS